MYFPWDHTIVIAEAGVNHDGQLDKAIKLAEAAADVADIIYADIDPDASRDRNLVLKPGEFELRLLEDRRPDLYGIISEPRPAQNRLHHGAERSKT